MKPSQILFFLAFALIVLSCRETIGEQHNDIHNQRNFPDQNKRGADSVLDLQESKPRKTAPSKKKPKARDTLKPKIAELQLQD